MFLTQTSKTYNHVLTRFRGAPEPREGNPSAILYQFSPHCPQTRSGIFLLLREIPGDSLVPV